MRIYAESLHPSYQRDIGALFGRCAETMSEGSIPARMAKDWVIVRDYLRCASTAIAEHLGSPGAEPRLSDAVSSTEIEGRGSPPLVIRFDALARLTTSGGARRLEQAAVAVREHLDDLAPETIDDRERHMLKRLAAGTAIVDIAAEMNYSERTIYRALASLWDKLGVPGREDGIRKAVSERLLDGAPKAGSPVPIRQADDEHGVAREPRRQDGREAVPDAAGHGPAQDLGHRHRQHDGGDQHDPGLDPVDVGERVLQQRLAVGLGQHADELPHQRSSLSCPPATVPG